MAFPSISRVQLTGVAVACGAFMLYAATCAREPVFGDGLEFAAAAAALGVPHPTGYPLLTMLLAIAGGGSYFAATLMCALFAAGGTGLAFALAARAFGSPAPALVCAILWAVSTSVWRSATSVEVYGLNALLLLGVVALLLPGGGGAPSLRCAALACFVQGLALCNHLSSVALVPLVGVQVVRAALERRGASARVGAIAACLACGAAGLLPWIWLPLRARANPAINWGDPQTLESFLWIARGGDYAQTQFLMEAPGHRFSTGGWLAFAGGRVVLLLRSAGAELLGGVRAGDSAFRIGAQLLFGGLLAAAAAAGIAHALRRCRWTAIALLAAAAFQLFLVLTYNIRDIGDYFLGLWATLLPFVLAGAARGAAALHGKFAASPRVPVFAAVAVVLCTVLSNLGAARRSDERIARVWIDRALDALPPDAIVLTQADYDAYGLWYAQLVERRRRDVLVVGANFLRYGWYASMLPEAGADPAGRIATAHEHRLPRSAEEHVGMVDRAVIAPNVGKFPVFITDGDPVVLQVLARTYRVEAAAVLLEGITDLEIEQAMERLPALPPPMLYRIAPPAAPEPPTP